LELPVVLTIALKTGPEKYEVFMESLSDGRAVPIADRKLVVSKQIQNFASRLEHYCLKEPNGWISPRFKYAH
jgi:predicted LPLAT superfamily acyltransferase